MNAIKGDFGSLADILRRNAAHFSDVPAVLFEGKARSHRDLLSRARCIGSALAQRGIGPGDRVAILSHNAMEFTEIYAATELAGLVAVPLNHRLAQPEIGRILLDAEPALLFYQSGFADMVDELKPALGSIRHFVRIAENEGDAEDYSTLVKQGDPAWEEPRFASGEIAHLLYTSGTTGRPKGCLQSHRSSAFAANNISAVMQSDCHDRGLLVMPICHAGGKRFQMATHWQAGSLYMLRAFDTEKVLRTIAEEKITILHLAPTMIQMLLEYPGSADYDLGSVKTAVYGAAPMPLPLLRRGIERFGQIFVQMYGQTEGDGLVLAKGFHQTTGEKESVRRLTSIGHPTPGVELRVADEDDNPVPDGTAGEMLLRSPTVMEGYWRDAQASEQTLRGGWLHTGDIVVRDPDGFIHLVDRKKDLIISGGLNISSREVEDALMAHPDVLEASAIGVPDDKWGEAVLALIVLRPGAAFDAAALTALCRQHIAGYKVPKAIRAVTELPRLPTGKINKVELRKRHAGPPEAGSRLAVDRQRKP